MGSAPARLLSLDALRGFAVFCMIEQHLGVWLWTGPQAGETRFDYPGLVAFNAAAGIGLPIFFGLAGIGSALMVATRKDGVEGVLVKRGVLLMALGYLLNVTAPDWFSWGSFFALHLIGFGMALTPLWARLSNRHMAVAITLVLAATPLVQAWLGTPDKLHNEHMSDVAMPGGVFRLALAESQYPILPWLSIYLAGVVSGRWVALGRHRALLWAAVSMVAIGALGHGLFRVMGDGLHPVLARAFVLRLGFFPGSVAMLCLLIGGGGLLVAAALRVEASYRLSSRHPMVTMGRTSLSVFFVHVWVFRQATQPLGLRDALTANETLVVIFGFTALWMLVTRAWAAVGYRFGAEWLLRTVAR